MEYILSLLQYIRIVSICLLKEVCRNSRKVCGYPPLLKQYYYSIQYCEKVSLGTVVEEELQKNFYLKWRDK